MFDNNVVVLRGRVTSEPRVRELPSGTIVTQIEVTTRSDGGVASVPVAVVDRSVGCSAGDDVVVAGHVRRRFYRAGGVTQSRTEVVAADVVRIGRRRAVERLIGRVVECIQLDP